MMQLYYNLVASRLWKQHTWSLYIISCGWWEHWYL